MSRFLVDVCIPVYKEKGYIERTLKNLSNQNLYKQGKVNIIVGEYKEPENRFDTYVRNLCTLFPNTVYLNVDQKGIGYARAYMVDKAVLSDIIMCFDADSVFNRLDAIDLMIAPILSGEAVMTNCESISYDFFNNRRSKFEVNIYNINDEFAKLQERVILSRGQGLTVSKSAYYAVGGFESLSRMEDTFLSLNVSMKYGLDRKKFIEEVKILTSDRRSKAFETVGSKAFDYKNNNFR